MSITDELLRKFAGPNHEGPHHDMAGELLALRARVAKLEAALREIGREQSAKTATVAADKFQSIARTALMDTPQ
jgi:hypothetical protein